MNSQIEAMRAWLRWAHTSASLQTEVRRTCPEVAFVPNTDVPSPKWLCPLRPNYLTDLMDAWSLECVGAHKRLCSEKQAPTSALATLWTPRGRDTPSLSPPRWAPSWVVLSCPITRVRDLGCAGLRQSSVPIRTEPQLGPARPIFEAPGRRRYLDGDADRALGRNARQALDVVALDVAALGLGQQPPIRQACPTGLGSVVNHTPCTPVVGDVAHRMRQPIDADRVQRFQRYGVMQDHAYP